MRRRAEPEVFAAAPVLQIVAAFKARAREIADLILPVAERLQALDREEVLVRRAVLVGQAERRRTAAKTVPGSIFRM